MFAVFYVSIQILLLMPDCRLNISDFTIEVIALIANKHGADTL